MAIITATVTARAGSDIRYLMGRNAAAPSSVTGRQMFPKFMSAEAACLARDPRDDRTSSPARRMFRIPRPKKAM
jgi:hypothetical protein